MSFRFLSLLVAAGLAGCAANAPQRLDPPAAPAAFKNAVAQPATATVPDAWWQLFQDPQLDALQAQLLTDNEDVRAALARLDAARAALGQLQAAQQPSLGLTAGATRADTGNSTQNSLRAELAASWEPDLFGRLRLATEAGDARVQATEADLAALRLAAQAALVQSYFELRTAEAQQALFERSITAFQRSLTLTRDRYQGGVVSVADVLQAETQLRTAQVQAVEAGNARALAEHAIAVLLGQAPSSLTLPTTASLPPPPPVPELLPGTLLQRRPDVRAAERRVAAAQAQVGVADTAFFPSFSLSASAGTRADTLRRLFDAPSLVWSLGPTLAQRLLDGGARTAASAQARAEAEQAGAAYRKTVLLALQEVEDRLLLATQLQTQQRLQSEGLDAARRLLDITQEQYRVGTVSYLNVVTAQTAVLSSERNLLDLRARQLSATNQLLKNVAGRW